MKTIGVIMRLPRAHALVICLLAALVLAGAAAGDAYRRQELDAKLMDAAKPTATGGERKEVFALRGDSADAGEFLRGKRIYV